MHRQVRFLLALLLVLLIGISAGCAPNDNGPAGRAPDEQKPSDIYTSQVKQKWLDVPYADRSEAEKLDIYLPSQGQGPFPVIVSIHGGAFMYGDKADGNLVPVLKGLDRGYAVVSINYRLSGEAKFPSQVNDVKAAIRFIRANAARYQLNPDKIAVWGGSAGGYLALAAGITSDVAELDDPGLGSPGQSSRVQAVVDWCGPTDFRTLRDQLLQNRFTDEAHISTDWAEKDLFGRPLPEVPELARMADLSAYITPDDPPIYIQHGARDPVVPPQQSTEFVRHQQSVPGSKPVAIQVFPYEEHLGYSFTSPDNLDRVFIFIDRSLK
ncbi:MAG: alpha/beta hydrolase [Firmicutes bacterium]|nr:alpha/beta hydrolase [Bacillota bacterium]